jgi:hypothetical protein
MPLIQFCAFQVLSHCFFTHLSPNFSLPGLGNPTGFTEIFYYEGAKAAIEVLLRLQEIFFFLDRRVAESYAI